MVKFQQKYFFVFVWINKSTVRNIKLSLGALLFRRKMQKKNIVCIFQALLNSWRYFFSQIKNGVLQNHTNTFQDISEYILFSLWPVTRTPSTTEEQVNNKSIRKVSGFNICTFEKTFANKTVCQNLIHGS